MTVIPFIAESAAAALDQIRAQLGTSAVVLNVRRLPASGLSRLWRRYGRIEVLACLPDEAAVASQTTATAACETENPGLDVGRQTSPSPVSQLHALHAMGGGRQERSSSDVSLPGRNSLPRAVVEPFPQDGDPFATLAFPPDTRWRSRVLLERMGLLPLHAARILDDVRTRHGEEPPAMFFEELALCTGALVQHWRKPVPLDDGRVPRPHVFIGPPGSGKTTALCKWLANSVLLEGRSARVWRLDAHAANTAESLSVYGEILGVPVERFWARDEAPTANDLLFVDLPGVDPQDRAAFDEFTVRLRQLPGARVHLVLNAAYDTTLLLAQARAFAALTPEDIIFTHLDEETRWTKLWNLVLGTNFTIRFLGAGQNIPGKFLTATPEQLFPPGFRPQTLGFHDVPPRWQMTC